MQYYATLQTFPYATKWNFLNGNRNAVATLKHIDHLHDIEGTELHPATFLGVVDLRALDNDCVRWQIHTPGQRGRRDQHLDVSVGKQVLDQRTVDPATCQV